MSYAAIVLVATAVVWRRQGYGDRQPQWRAFVVGLVVIWVAFMVLLGVPWMTMDPDSGPGGSPSVPPSPRQPDRDVTPWLGPVVRPRVLGARDSVVGEGEDPNTSDEVAVGLG